MAATAAAGGVELDVHHTASRVWADADKIQQALINLLSNSVKFSPPGGTVTLAAETDGDGVHFSVADQGRGIPADKLETIFDRFVQVDPSDSRDKGGTGLGLSIVRSIVERHGGRVWARSVEGEGSTFTLALRSSSPPRPAAGRSSRRPEPIRCRQSWTPSRPSCSSMRAPSTRGPPCTGCASTRERRGSRCWRSRTPRPATDRRPGSRRLAISTVVVVEDDPDLCMVLEAIFASHGAQTHTAVTGREALELLADVTPDLLVLDPMRLADQVAVALGRKR